MCVLNGALILPSVLICERPLEDQLKDVNAHRYLKFNVIFCRYSGLNLAAFSLTSQKKKKSLALQKAI